MKWSVIHLPGKVFLPLVMALLLNSLLTSTAWAERHRKVLVLYDENTDFPALALLDRSLKEAFKAGTTDRIDLYTESMDLARFQDDRYMELLGTLYRQKYANQRIDLAIAVMGPALDFPLRYGAELFSGTPMVFCGISRHEREGRDLGPNVTGVLVERQFKRMLDLALILQPDTRQVVVIGGTASFNKYWGAIARQEFRDYEGRLAFTYLTTHSMQEILQGVVHLPKHTIILYLHLFKDSVGTMFMPDEALSLISQAANAPVYGFVDQFLGRGIVGGYLFSLDMHGSEAAAINGATFDLATTLEAAQSLSSEITLDRLLETTMAFVIEHVGSQRGVCLREHDGRWLIVARQDGALTGGTNPAPVPIEACEEISLSPDSTLGVDEALGSHKLSDTSMPSTQHLEKVERAYILAVLDACQGCIKGAGQAAERLQLHPSTLYSRMRKLGIERKP